MTALTAVPPLALVAALVVLPLVREYIAFRREWGASALGALGASSTLLPAVALGLAVSQPLAAEPALQWLATVLVTVAAYSLATAALRPTLASEAPRRSS